MTPKFIQTVEGLFATDFSAMYPGVVIGYDNTTIPQSAEIETFLNVLASEDVIPINLGINAKSRNVGLIQVDVLVPKDEGAGNAYNYAHNAGKVFKRRVISVPTEGTITFRDPGIKSMGDVRGKFSYMMRAPYRYDFDDT